jgi:hypothetical protein
MSIAITRVVGGAMRRALGARRQENDLPPDRREVSLLPGASAAPEALEHRLIVDTLGRHGQLRIGALVELVATAVYRDTLRGGGSVADLGVFGPRVFVPDVLNALEAGNGSLWTISAARTSAN